MIFSHVPSFLSYRGLSLQNFNIFCLLLTKKLQYNKKMKIKEKNTANTMSVFSIQ